MLGFQPVKTRSLWCAHLMTLHANVIHEEGQKTIHNVLILNNNFNSVTCWAGEIVWDENDQLRLQMVPAVTVCMMKTYIDEIQRTCLFCNECTISSISLEDAAPHQNNDWGRYKYHDPVNFIYGWASCLIKHTMEEDVTYGTSSLIGWDLASHGYKMDPNDITKHQST